VTRIWHPQVHLPDGAPCVDVLTKGWTKDMTLRHVLLTLRQLIASPSAAVSSNADAAAEMSKDLAAFEEHAREETKRWAIES
jgi:ubiquitin-protein ligase